MRGIGEWERAHRPSHARHREFTALSHLPRRSRWTQTSWLTRPPTDWVMWRVNPRALGRLVLAVLLAGRL